MADETPDTNDVPARRDTAHRDQLMRAQFRRKETAVTRFDALAYSMFGEFFDARRDSLGTFDLLLKHARLPIDEDLYLSRMTLLTVLVTVAGLCLSTPLFLALALMGTFDGVLVGLPAPADVLLIVIGLMLGVGGGLLISGLAGLYLNLALRASSRKRAINKTTPHAVTFMYALSRGGMNFVEVMRTLSEAEDVYGAVAEDFNSIMRDMEYLSVDLPRALRRGAQRTPSPKLEDFLDDLVSVIDSGADLTGFLRDKSEEMLDEAEREQKGFLQTLALLGEVYVTAFVAGPLFLIIITVVMSMLGGGAIMQLYGIVYGMLPVMNLAFFLLIDTITADEGKLESMIETDRTTMTAEEVKAQYGPYANEENRVESIIEAKEYRERSAWLRDPIGWMLENPVRTAAATVPIAVVYTLLMGLIGIVPLSLTAMEAEPIVTTAAYMLVPILIVFIPLSVFYEISSRRRDKMLNRLPDALKQLASANAIGMTLTESLNTVAESTHGELATQMEQVSNDITWYNDINEALVAFANRVKLPVVARTVKLITEANQSTGDIADVLDVAAKDVGKRQMLQRERSNEMMMYTVVVLISYAVYLFVIAMLDSAFLSEIAKLGAESGSGTGPESASQVSDSAQGGMGGMSLTDLPIDRFRMVFYHSTIIQAIGSGLLAGQLGKNEVLAGLKYSIVLMLVSTTVFWFL